MSCWNATTLSLTQYFSDYQNDLEVPSYKKLLIISINENNACKIFRPVQELNLRPPQYRCSALPTELTKANWEMVTVNI